MKMSLYFLFYVVMVLELLIFIVERDAAEDDLKSTMTALLQQLSSVDEVKVFGTKALKLGENDTVDLAYHTFTLISDSERASIKYQVKRSYSYNGDSLGVFKDTTLWSGAEVSKTEVVKAQIFDNAARKKVWKTALVTVQLSRDNTTGDAVVRVIHALPPKPGFGKTDTLFREGEVLVEVLPILRRSFPIGLESNIQNLLFLRDHYNQDGNHFKLRCIPYITKISFTPTGTIKVGPG